MFSRLTAFLEACLELTTTSRNDENSDVGLSSSGNHVGYVAFVAGSVKYCNVPHWFAIDGSIWNLLIKRNVHLHVETSRAFHQSNASEGKCTLKTGQSVWTIRPGHLFHWEGVVIDRLSKVVGLRMRHVLPRLFFLSPVPRVAYREPNSSTRILGPSLLILVGIFPMFADQFDLQIKT